MGPIRHRVRLNCCRVGDLDADKGVTAGDDLRRTGFLFFGMPTQPPEAGGQTAGGYGSTLLIMADESVWDEDDISKLMADGGCRAINLKIQKAGGVLPCLRGAEAAVAANPDIRIYVGNMVGTSALTTRTLSSLAMASPRLDYFTAITNPLSGLTVREALGDEGRGASARSPSHGGAQAEAGMGAELDLEGLSPYLTRHHPFGTGADALRHGERRL